MTLETSVIVSSYNQPRTLALVLEGLKLQQGEDFEVVIADDGSTARTRQLVEGYAREVRFPVGFVTQPDRGFRKSRALNNGIRMSTGHYVLFLDGDCVPPPGWMGAHMAALRGKADYAVAGYINLDLEDTEKLTVEDLRSGEYLRLATPAALQRVRAIHWRNRFRRPLGRGPKILGGNFSVRRAALERVNGFDERYEGFGKEDSDLRNRLHACGYRGVSLWHRNWVIHCHHGVDPERCTADVVRSASDKEYYDRHKGRTSCERGIIGRDSYA